MSFIVNFLFQIYLYKSDRDREQSLIYWFTPPKCCDGQLLGQSESRCKDLHSGLLHECQGPAALVFPGTVVRSWNESRMVRGLIGTAVYELQVLQVAA